MISSHNLDCHDLLQKAANGNQAAVEQLLDLHRERLRAMIALRLDHRLVTRVDPSDVVQETLAEAFRKLAEYLHSRPVPFYVWLRQIAWDKIHQLYRQHVLAQRRTVAREKRLQMVLPEHSTMQLANRLVSPGSSPSSNLARRELKARVTTALSRLSSHDREVLILRYLEQLSTEETAAVLGMSVEAVRSRQRRALERFSNLVGGELSGDAP
jgi:RNA polymerase sigma-70 factor (ECF subfamily)